MPPTPSLSAAVEVAGRRKEEQWRMTSIATVRAPLRRRNRIGDRGGRERETETERGFRIFYGR